jgi:hypothetical protein
MEKMHSMIGAALPHHNPRRAQAGNAPFVRSAIVARIHQLGMDVHGSCSVFSRGPRRWCRFGRQRTPGYRERSAP